METFNLLKEWWFYITLLVLYLLFGIAHVEMVWKDTVRARNVDEARDSKFPAFRRIDAYKWQKWKLYPAGVFLLPIRLVSGFSWLLFITIAGKCMMIGQDRSKPITGFRHKIIFWSYYAVARIIVTICGFFPEINYLSDSECDYSEYLGPDYLA